MTIATPDAARRWSIAVPLAFLLGALIAPTSEATLGRCQPCAGLTVADPAAALQFAQTVAAGKPLTKDQVLYLRWRARPGVDPVPTPSLWRDLAAAGITPWVTIELATPPPLLANTAALTVELEAVAALARETPAGTFFELRWAGGEPADADASEAAFLIKRAAVAISGANPDAQVLFAPRTASVADLELLYAQEVAAYLDGITVAAETNLEGYAARLAELDPGSELALVGLPVTAAVSEVLVEAARAAERGASIGLFATAAPSAELAQTLALIAREFSGDVAIDPYSTASGAESWAFVRGDDLSLRVVVKRPSDQLGVNLQFSSGQLTSPALFDPATGEPAPLFGGSRTRSGYRLPIAEAPAAFLLRLDRAGVGDLAGVEGVEERVLVEDVRTMPVEEILRRLQAVEDAQTRRLETYSAVNTTSMRFQIGGSVQSIDATFRGAFFFRRDQPADWAWEEFLVNGVRWRSKRIPQIPLLQPEKASALPVEITFSRDYRYSLRGTAQVEGRDCWVVDFEPAVRPEPGRTLFQGTVWVDRELYTRVRTRGVQLGLEGEVQSNDETITYSPVDSAGQTAPWALDSFFLPLRLVGQQVLSLLGSTTVVEREVLLDNLSINAPEFEARRSAMLSGPATMLRDTEQGLRYLVADENTGERVVQEELDPTRLFLAGGAFYDKSFDFPVPLLGINWFSYDWKGTGTQVNAFFAGPLLTLNVASPTLFGSKFTGGVDIVGFAIAGTDSIFRGDREAVEEDVKALRPNIDLNIGRPIGNFFTLDLEYSLGWNKFRRAEDTATGFVLPSDHLSHSFTLSGRYNRKGYRLRAFGREVLRDQWEPWGLPAPGGLEPALDSYSKWGASVAKVWHLPKFQKVGAEIEYFGGRDLDRFSKYEFGFFSEVRVHGYRSDRVRAEEAYATHLSYGLGFGELFRLDLVGDAAWATDRESGLERELLAGVGLVGTLTGPWSTVLNIDIGFPVAGPDSGFSALIAILKLFR